MNNVELDHSGSVLWPQVPCSPHGPNKDAGTEQMGEKGAGKKEMDREKAMCEG